MDEYKKTPSDDLQALKRGDIDVEQYLDQTGPELVDRLTEDVRAKREREQSNAIADYLLSDDT